jgi:hypothetical protein
MNSRLCPETGSYEYKARVLPSRWWFIKDLKQGLSDCKSGILPTLSCNLAKTGTETSQRKSGVLIYSTVVAHWLRCCVTNRKVAGSFPAGVSGFFFDIKSFRSHYGLEVDSASNRNEYQEYFLGVKAAGA